jgi:hypothetical protein
MGAFQHIGTAHPGASDKDLANMAVVPCPVEDCRLFFSLQRCAGSNPRSGIHQHLGAPTSRRDAAHTAHISRNASPGQIDKELCARAVAIADPGTPGSCLPCSPELVASYAASLGSAGTPIASTTPPPSFDMTVLDAVERDGLRRVQLLTQDDPSKLADRRAVYQPAVHGLKCAAELPATPSTAEAARGLKYYFACLAIVFCRPLGTPPRTEQQMLALARSAASSAHSFTAAWRTLIASAAPLADRTDAPPPPPPPPLSAASDAASLADATKPAVHLAARGNTGKAWRSLSQSDVVPAAAAAVTLTALTPQICVMADVPGAEPYVLSKKVFTKSISGLKHCVAPGTLHTTYERVQGVCAAGGAGYMYNLAAALANGTVHEAVSVQLTDLRALCVFKPDRTHRPLGLPEAETRAILGSVATQERPALDAFYTSPLPEDVAAKGARIAAARTALELASVKLQSATSAADAEGQERAAADIADAQAIVEAEQLPANIPINHAFSSRGCQKVSHILDV